MREQLELDGIETTGHDILNLEGNDMPGNTEPGIIGVASGFLGRYREFSICLQRIKAPPQTIIDWRMGVCIAMHFNDMIRTMLSDEQYKWLWILGDDHVFDPDLLMNLLNRNVDVVVPLCLKRVPPYLPIIFGGREQGFQPLGWGGLANKTGLVKLESSLLGNAGMLIRRHVAEKMPSPWFENGRMNPELGGCDLWFCQKLHDLGLGLHLDTDNAIGHLSHVSVWPVRNANGHWTPDLRTPIKYREGVDEK